MTYTELEVAYLTLCKAVERDVARIVGLCLANRVDTAGNAAADLLESVENTRLQYQMAQEHVAGSYDLATLRVDATTASNSETGFERED